MNHYHLHTFFALFLILFSCGGNQEQAAETSRSARPVMVAQAEVTDLSDARTVSAPVVAYRRVYVTAQTEGQVLEVNFEEGDRVRKGQVLARLDTRRQQAQLRMANARLLEARQNFDRQKKLFEQEVITPVEFESATLMLEQAESDVEFWTVEVGLGTIESTIDAVVTARLVEPGNTVNTNDRLFTIEDHNLLVVRPALSELDVAKLQRGQELELIFDVFGDEPFPGTIRRIFPAADAISRLFTVEVEIHQNRIPHVIRPGYLVRSRFILDDRSNTLAVPSEAMKTQNGENFVFLIKEDKAILTKVERGIERDGKVEIRAGISKGDKVAAGNISALEDGSDVRIAGTFRRHGFIE